MKRSTSLPAAGARIATSVTVGLAAVVLFACADDSSTTAPSPAASAVSAGRIPVAQENRIVYQSNRDPLGSFDIYSMLPDGSGNTRLTSSFDNFYPALSPDGTRVVFTSNRDNPMYDIYVMNSDGSYVKRLAASAAANYNPRWSADGTKIIFTSTRGAADPTDRGLSASWEVYLMNSDGSNLKRVTNNTVGEWDPDLSPDGTQIVFASDRDHPRFSWNRDLYLMNVDGTNVRRLTSQDGTIEAPRFDASGQRVVYDVMNGSAPGIYVLAGHSPTRLTFDAGGSIEFTPTWSPDGTQIAYTHFVSGTGSQIYKMNADGSNQKRVTRDPAYAQRPDWGR